MLLKEKLQDYTQAEFVEFIKAIWLSTGPQLQVLIKHYMLVVDLSDSERLLFDPPLAMTFGNDVTAEAVAAYVKLRHNQSGRPAFSDDALPKRVSGVRPNREQAALQRSVVNQAAARLLVTGVQSAGSSLHEALERFAELLGQFAEGESAALQLPTLLETTTALEIALEAVDKAISRFEFFEQRLELTLKDAQRSISSPSLNTSLQNEIFNDLNRSWDDYRLQLSTTRQRRLELHGRSVAVFSKAQKQLASLRLAEGSSRPRTFQASLANAFQCPGLLLCELPTQSLAMQFSGLQGSIRSAMAALTSATLGAGGVASDSYAGVLAFYFNNISDDHDFGLCVPLAEVTHPEGVDWHAEAAALGQVELPVRLCCAAGPFPLGKLRRGLRDVTSVIHVRLARAKPGEGVRVRPALLDEDGQGFSFADAGVRISWRAGDISAEPIISGKPPKIGIFHTSPIPVLEFFETLQDVRFNDYVVVFPQDSGHPPLYVMLRDSSDSLPGSPLPIA